MRAVFMLLHQPWLKVLLYTIHASCLAEASRRPMRSLYCRSIRLALPAQSHISYSK